MHDRQQAHGHTIIRVNPFMQRVNHTALRTLPGIVGHGAGPEGAAAGINLYLKAFLP
jgi:hypothetical protein